ncbi:spore cortex biosynthesis protein YabQ [Bacillus methanolicus PB1]|uniref:Spore cortex biosynthesis protein YabQ n=1 Tax=Bacillus methanolicus PB1 TaxID=997296 RepID=I3E0Q5_BACMT|nr:spore cortex biosynthesis protein YabQ [Bacillus methanolicus]EIJ80076.1 spore cortex biosynthesis protein YabQ [Bacillus methanolicus PB1]
MTLSTQFITMLAMIGMGSFFGAALDTYNRFLQRTRRKKWFVFINDLLFWLLQALIIFYVLFLVNKGEIRFFIFIALLCGFAAYQSLVKQLYLRLLELAVSMFVATYKFTIKTIQMLIIKPLQSLFLLVISIIVMIGRGLFSLVKYVFKALTFIVKTLWWPSRGLLFFFWKLMPKNIKKIVEKLYNKMAGIIHRLKKIVISIKNKWKNRKE